MKNTSLSTCRVRDVGDERAFFISANGHGGFRTRQDILYRSEDFTRIFIIVGGPGTGKSSLMRTVAEAADMTGAECEYIYCSSDPNSLDGVILTRGARRVALLDGTAPHERGAHLPGAVDEFVHLDSCWDADVLTQNREIIQKERKAADAAYARARHYLAIAGQAQKGLDGELDKVIDQEKLKAAVMREIRSLRITNRPFEEVRYLSACGGGGYIRLNTFVKESEVIAVSNACGAAHRCLNELLSYLRRDGVYGYWRFPSCYDDEITEGIYLPQNKRLYLIDNGESYSRKINIKRFIKKEKEVISRAHIRRFLHLHEGAVAAAVDGFSEAAAHHFALEDIYGHAMDFSKKEILAFLVSRKVMDALADHKRD